MKRFFLLAICSIIFTFAAAQPSTVHVDGGSLHVQGIAYDSYAGFMYMSFTSAFYKTDMNGKVVASVSGINGHLGAMTFDPVGRKVYASLEFKDDSIGKGISSNLGAREWTRSESVFYIAVIDVDKVTAIDMKQDDAITLVKVDQACRDYLATVENGGQKLDHRYACSGIDGVTIGPAIGSTTDDGQKFLYVAYGIYGDTSRTDNDYNIILAYPLDYVMKCAGKSRSERRVLSKVSARYFVHTGNTTWGVQNLAYDPSTRQLLMAVYRGKKKQWPNYSLFALAIDQKPIKAPLDGVEYNRDKVTQLSVCGNWFFKWGSTGMCPLGDGRFYISQNGRKNGNQYCDATLYRWCGSSNPDIAPFKKMK